MATWQHSLCSCRPRAPAEHWELRAQGLSEAGGIAYAEFRIGDYQGELGLVDRGWAPPGAPTEPGGAVVYWHVDDIEATFEKLLAMGAKEYQPITPPRGDMGFVTAAVVDPFGNVLGVMYNPHFLEVLQSRGRGASERTEGAASS